MMIQALEIYIEPMEAEEIAFLKKKVRREGRIYYKVLTGLMVLSFLIPFAGSWYSAYEGAPNAFSKLRYFSSATVLLCLSFAGVWVSYKVNLKRIIKDLRQRTKTIECARITRKTYMPHNNTYFFYIDSPNKLSIEVDEAFYRRMNVGDEVNIEYTTNARYYLGYY